MISHVNPLMELQPSVGTRKGPKSHVWPMSQFYYLRIHCLGIEVEAEEALNIMNSDSFVFFRIN